ncbi:hypothetical protein EJD97_019877 [Solanum chilense]|uniref:HECT-type E3 ubiquitin transferase n=1 Tax=Solanum chilense TaxID=4083 RepID=A0A6N2B695_SOLCI|nr:hypothetical protein EJD97_019877 [Solanum chilense]
MADQLPHDTSTKRKLNDHTGASTARMRHNQILFNSSLRTPIQFFVRMFSGKTLVIQADSSDTVASVHWKIHSITGLRPIESTSSAVPSMQEGLIYRGKQLELSQTLSECGIQNDDTLQLVRRMRSMHHPQTWKLMSDLNLIIDDLCNCNDNPNIITYVTRLSNMLTDFLIKTPNYSADGSEEYLHIFIHSSVPSSLVKLYVSPSLITKQAAHGCICQFVQNCLNHFTNPTTVYRLIAPILFEFCTILRGAAGVDDDLYLFFRSRLAAMMQENVHDVKHVLTLHHVFPFVDELATTLSHSLELSAQSPDFKQLSDSDVLVFIQLMHSVEQVIRRQTAFGSPVSLPWLMQDEEANELKGVHTIICNLLDKMELCLKELENQLALVNIGRREPIVGCWFQYLLILKELESISKLYKGLKEMFWEKMSRRGVGLCYLIGRLSKKSTDYEWILEHKEVTNFKTRQRFALQMLQEGRHMREELWEMLISRSSLFEDSFQYIGHASRRSLRGQLFIRFENEEATGPGVLREWFSLVCEAIFNPQNALFVSCPNDGRRFFPNPVSKVDPLHLEYFVFSGRIIALALLHRVQVGITFDRVFFRQLAGEDISFEDIIDADPYLYRGCKDILEMDAKVVDEDILGLTFVREYEELGSRNVEELCPNGRSMIVNSRNRDNYVNLLVKHRFVTSIAHQVAHFARGFADIITDRELRESFYRILDHEDLNRMLHGSKTAVSVEDWKEHTNYSGYKKDDPQISWFWEIVGSMSAEQRNVLLFFWTSIKSLPVEGFGGLDSKLHIYRISDSHDCLPTSHTCFYRLCFPPYPSMEVMQNRLNIITQNYVGCSFGAA